MLIHLLNLFRCGARGAVFRDTCQLLAVFSYPTIHVSCTMSYTRSEKSKQVFVGLPDKHKTHFSNRQAVMLSGKTARPTWFRLVAATANRVVWQRTRWHSVQMKRGHLKWVEMRWDEMTDRNDPLMYTASEKKYLHNIFCQTVSGFDKKKILRQWCNVLLQTNHCISLQSVSAWISYNGLIEVTREHEVSTVATAQMCTCVQTSNIWGRIDAWAN